MGAGAPAQTRLLGHACLFHPTGNRQNNQSTFHRGNGGVPPFPQPAGGAKETAYAQGNPQRTHPLERIPTDTSGRSPLLIPPRQAAEQPRHTLPPKRVPSFHNRQAVQRKRRTPKATPTSALARTYHHRHVCTGTPARSPLLIPPHQPAEQAKHIPPRR